MSWEMSYAVSLVYSCEWHSWAQGVSFFLVGATKAQKHLGKKIDFFVRQSLLDYEPGTSISIGN